MDKQQLIVALEALLAASPRPAEELDSRGFRLMDTEDAIRALLRGQLLLVTPACVRDILRELKGGG